MNFSNFSISYIKLNIELYDAIVKINDEKVGVEITQLITDKKFNEFKRLIEDFITKEILPNYVNHKSLLDIELNYEMFSGMNNGIDKRAYKEYKQNLKQNISDILSEKYNPQNKNSLITNYEIIENDQFDISINNTTIIERLSPSIIEEKIRAKDKKLKTKLKNVSNPDYSIAHTIDKRWLLFYSDGQPYDDYHKIEEKTIKNIKSKYFDKVVFFNKKRQTSYIVDLE